MFKKLSKTGKCGSSSSQCGAKKPEPAEAKPTQPIGCAVCNAVPRGRSFRCIDCYNFTLCGSCEKLVVHNHPMVRTFEPIEENVYFEMNKCYIEHGGEPKEVFETSRCKKAGVEEKPIVEKVEEKKEEKTSQLPEISAKKDDGNKEKSTDSDRKISKELDKVELKEKRGETLLKKREKKEQKKTEKAIAKAEIKAKLAENKEALRKLKLEKKKEKKEKKEKKKASKKIEQEAKLLEKKTAQEETKPEVEIDVVDWSDSVDLEDSERNPSEQDSLCEGQKSPITEEDKSSDSEEEKKLPETKTASVQSISQKLAIRPVECEQVDMEKKKEFLINCFGKNAEQAVVEELLRRYYNLSLQEFEAVIRLYM